MADADDHRIHRPRLPVRLVGRARPAAAATGCTATSWSGSCGWSGWPSDPRGTIDKGFTPERQSASFRQSGARAPHADGHVAAPADGRDGAGLPRGRRRPPPPSRARGAMLRALRVAALLRPAARRARHARRRRAARRHRSRRARAPGSPSRRPRRCCPRISHAARAADARAVALSHKLAPASSGPSGYRYTCPSYEVAARRGRRRARGARVSSRWPPTRWRSPTCARGRAPRRPRGGRRGAGVGRRAAGHRRGGGGLRVGLDEARERLGRVAAEEHVGFDGLWHLNGAAA